MGSNVILEALLTHHFGEFRLFAPGQNSRIRIPIIDSFTLAVALLAEVKGEGGIYHE